MSTTTIHGATFIRTRRDGATTLFEIDGREVWFPSEQIQYDWTASKGEAVDIDMPTWLARDRDLT